MSNELDSDARCLKAIELTFRFVLTCFVPLALLLVSVCFVFGNGYKPGVNAGLMILVSYFTMAYLHTGRGNRASLVIAGLAGLTTPNVAAAAHRSDDASAVHPMFNPETGLMMMGDFDTVGNLYGFGTTSGGILDDDASGFDVNHLSFNPANGLPMLDEVIDIQGNVFGSSSDDFTDHGSAFDDSITLSSFDDSFNNSPFDDDWNK